MIVRKGFLILVSLLVISIVFLLNMSFENVQPRLTQTSHCCHCLVLQFSDIEVLGLQPWFGWNDIIFHCFS